LSVRTRVLSPELIDDPELDPSLREAILQGLGRINRWSHSAGILWRPIQRLAFRTKPRPLRVLDIATGGGDVPISLSGKARSKGIALEVDGCDAEPHAVEYAAHHAKAQDTNVRFFRLDALEEPLPSGYDVLMCSLFLHHLSNEAACRLMARMAEAARTGMLVNDLLRSRRGLALAYAGAFVLSRSEAVHADAPQSVRAAFTLDEVARLAARAGLRDFRLGRRWPCRFLLEWNRP